MLNITSYALDLKTFLNLMYFFFQKVSYATLCSILEYIYVGEVLVAKDNIRELLNAAKELHILGLGDMVIF